MADFMIRFPALIAGIIGGFLLVRLFGIDRPIFYKWPSPDNAGKVKYKDKNGVCYQYASNVVDCSTNKDKIKPYPIQIPQPYVVMK